jgi:hypothetical protein
MLLLQFGKSHATNDLELPSKKHILLRLMQYFFFIKSTENEAGREVDLSEKDMSTQVFIKLNQKLLNDERISLSLIPIGDGLTLIRKNEN